LSWIKDGWSDAVIVDHEKKDDGLLTRHLRSARSHGLHATSRMAPGPQGTSRSRRHTIVGHHETTMAAAPGVSHPPDSGNLR
jgi:hypothetical protein